MIQPVKEKIILGIDPGTTIMGYGVLRVQGTKPEIIREKMSEYIIVEKITNLIM